MKFEETFKELGKGLITLANMLMVLLFFKEYFLNNKFIDLLSGVYAGLVIYVVGLIFIFIAENSKENK